MEAITELTQLMRIYGKTFYNSKLELCYDDNIRSEALASLPEYTKILYKYCAENFKGEKRIGNPTVHVALNQLNKVVNAIINKYGKPQNIIVEVGRKLKMSEDEKTALNKMQKKNEENNNKWIEEFSNFKLSYDDFQKLKLWEELSQDSRVCIFCGKVIERSMILTESIEIEHILPFSRTFDNGLANKVLSHRSCNGYKGNRTPYEAFAHSSEFKYDDILRRASLLPKNKRWRFNKDAMEKFNDENKFLARQLTDMQYISKIAVEYLACLYSKDEASKILGIPGRLTSMFRDKLGLNKILSEDSQKNRNDHRHHAIDALVVALTSRSLLQKVSTLSAQHENLYTGKANKLFEKLEQPWATFHRSVERAAGNIKISHKIDHGLQGRLHEDTAYGIIEPAEMGANLVVRKALENLTPKEISMIRDKSIRIKIEELRDKSETEQEFKLRLMQFICETNIKRVRVLKKDLPVAILSQNGKAYKALVGGDNLCVEIFKKESGEIDKEVIEKFHANQKGFTPKWMKDYPNAELIMRLYKGDIVRLNLKGITRLMIVCSVTQTVLDLTEIKEGGNFAKRRKEKDGIVYCFPSYSGMFDKYNLRHVYIDLLGNVKKATKPCIDLWNCGGVCDPKNCGKVNS